MKRPILVVLTLTPLMGCPPREDPEPDPPSELPLCEATSEADHEALLTVPLNTPHFTDAVSSRADEVLIAGAAGMYRMHVEHGLRLEYEANSSGAPGGGFPLPSGMTSVARCDDDMAWAAGWFDLVRLDDSGWDVEPEWEPIPIQDIGFGERSLACNGSTPWAILPLDVEGEPTYTLGTLSGAGFEASTELGGFAHLLHAYEGTLAFVDEDDRLWIGDGEAFEQMDLSEFGPVYDLFVGTSDVWAATEGGLVRWNGTELVDEEITAPVVALAGEEGQLTDYIYEGIYNVIGEQTGLIWAGDHTRSSWGTAAFGPILALDETGGWTLGPPVEGSTPDQVGHYVATDAGSDVTRWIWPGRFQDTWQTSTGSGGIGLAPPAEEERTWLVNTAGLAWRVKDRVNDGSVAHSTADTYCGARYNNGSVLYVQGTSLDPDVQEELQQPDGGALEALWCDGDGHAWLLGASLLSRRIPDAPDSPWVHVGSQGQTWIDAAGPHDDLYLISSEGSLCHWDGNVLACEEVPDAPRTVEVGPSGAWVVTEERVLQNDGDGWCAHDLYERAPKDVVDLGNRGVWVAAEERLFRLVDGTWQGWVTEPDLLHLSASDDLLYLHGIPDVRIVDPDTLER